MSTGGLVLAAAQGSAPLWYVTRGTGITALILLSAVVVLGITTSVGWSSRGWPKFFSQALHRDLSLLCLALIAVHVLTTILDGFVPFGFLDAVVPFHPPSRALWQGLGALSFDLFLALGITSALRRRIGYRMWKTIHWIAYLCWPFAVFHGLGAGTDTRLEPVLVIVAVCVSAVLVATEWRLAAWRRGHGGRRLLGGLGASVVTAALICFVALGPLQSDRSRRPGTPSLTTAGFSSGAKGRGTGQIAQPTGPGNQEVPSAAAAVPSGRSPGQSSQQASGPSGANSPNAGPASPLPPPAPAPAPPGPALPSIHIAPPRFDGTSTYICQHVTICRPTERAAGSQSRAASDPARLPRHGARSGLSWSALTSPFSSSAARISVVTLARLLHCGRMGPRRMEVAMTTSEHNHAVFLLTGISASGKSTVAELLAESSSSCVVTSSVGAVLLSALQLEQHDKDHEKLPIAESRVLTRNDDPLGRLPRRSYSMVIGPTARDVIQGGRSRSCRAPRLSSATQTGRTSPAIHLPN